MSSGNSMNATAKSAFPAARPTQADVLAIIESAMNPAFAIVEGRAGAGL
jgi:hypothetical protein